MIRQDFEGRENPGEKEGRVGETTRHRVSRMGSKQVHELNKPRGSKQIS